MKRNEIRIAPEPLIRLDNGRTIFSVIEAGEIIDGNYKDQSPRVATFREGSLVLLSDRKTVVVGPIDPDGAIDLARAVCSADPLALTGSQHIHILATALLGLAACLPAAPTDAPASAALTAEVG